MDDKVFVQDHEMEAIGDALRKASGTTGKFLPANMPDAIKDINLRLASVGTASGEFIHVTDAAVRKPLEFRLEGKTEQTQYEGKNLFDENKLQGGEFVDFNGVRCYKYIDNANNFTYTDEFKENTQHTVTAMFHRDDNTVDSSYLYFEYTDGSEQCIILPDLDKIYNKTSEKGKTVSGIRGSYNYGKVIYLDLSVMQVEEGTVATDYEPYVGGIPSPSPQYPQEIVNAGVLNEDTGKYEIECKVFNKNMFLLDKFIEVASGCSGCEIVTFDGRRCLHVIYPSSLYWKLEKYNQPFTEGQYTIRFDTYIISMSENLYGVGFAITYSDDSQLYCLPEYNIAPLNQWTTMCGTSASDKTCEYLAVSFGGTSECYIDLDSIQLEAGTEATTYEPPKQQTVTLTSDRPITKWDKLVKRDGVWGWNYASEKYEITGNEEWYVPVATNNYLTGSSSNMYFLPKNIVNNNGGSEIQCIWSERFSYVRYIWTKTDGEEGIAENNNQIHVRISNSTLGVSDDASDDEKKTAFKLYLQSQYNDGNPIIVYYESAEQAFTPLSDEEQTLLNDLETYYGVTNVYNDQGCPMWLTYVQDPKIAIDNKIKQLKS